jgi:ligand-binding SRPBCC domain-containing protein
MNQQPAHVTVFETSSILKSTMDRVLAFHQDPSALSMLTPPPIFTQLLEDRRSSLSAGDLIFRLWFGPIPVRWHAQHQAGPIPTSFADLMIAGPMAYWRHEHIFEVVPQGIRLTDRVTIAHKPGFRGLLTRLLFDGIPLRILFFYRHFRTRLAVERS